MLPFAHSHWKLPMDFILHFAICLMTQDFASEGFESLETWFPSSFACIFNFLYFSSEQEKRHLKKTTYSISSVQDCQTGRNYAYFRNTHAWRSPLSWEPAFLAHGYNCLWFYVPGICHWLHLVFLAGLYQIYLASISWPLWSPLGNICAVDYGNVILGYFSFFLLECQSSGYLYCVSFYLCGVLVVPCVFLFSFHSLWSNGVFWIIPYTNFESLGSVQLISGRISQDLR